MNVLPLIAEEAEGAVPKGGFWRLLAERYDAKGNPWPDKYNPELREATEADLAAIGFVRRQP